MAKRFGQMVLGMWLVLTRGLVREPGWGSGGAVPVHWTIAAMPLAGEIVCVVVALALIQVRERF